MTVIPRSASWYGWKPDTPDFRDIRFSLSSVTSSIPQSYDTRNTDWGIYDQGQLGSCTANATLSAYRHVLHREGHADFDGSRLAQYYWSRYLEGDTQSDGGAEIRDAVKVLTKFGVAPESAWPYIEAKVTRGPPAAVGKLAKQHVAIQYQSVALTMASLCGAIVQHGNVIVGISVYDSFESKAVAQTGKVPFPSSHEKLVGGHAIELIGYDFTSADNQFFIAKNSWGTDWGDHGYFYIPFNYITNPDLSDDAWTLVAVK